MKTKVVIFELRPPKNKEEKKLYGQTVTEGDVTRIFLNANQSQGELLNTYFHELAHAYFHWKGAAKGADEERICRLVGNVAEPCFRKYPK